MLFRSFIALPLTEDSRNRLAELIDFYQAQDKYNEISWPNSENYHITLAFLGDQLSSDLERLAEQLNFSEPPNIDIGFNTRELSYFPYHSRPKALAVILKLDSEIEQLKHYTDQTLRRCGISYDKRKFIPHITLGRIRGRKSPNLVIPPRYIDIDLHCSGLTLFHSDLRSDGAVYTPIFTINSESNRFDELNDTWI